MKALDLGGKVFGKLTAIEVVKIGSKRGWVCKCECGNYVNVPTFQLTSGNNISCGCAKGKVRKNQKYGKLLVMEVLYNRDNKKDDKLIAICKCDCGNEKNVYTRNLNAGVTTHCGCMRFENMSKGSRGEYGESSRKCLISSYKRNAKNKNRDFQLDDDYLNELFKGDCYYCGDEPHAVFSRPGNYGEYVYNGIDRLDSSKGYIKSNVVSCCATCNYLKSSYNEEDFLNIIRKISNHILINK